jgi:Fe2+ or Zn2+ uptake regulation protein
MPPTAPDRAAFQNPETVVLNVLRTAGAALTPREVLERGRETGYNLTHPQLRRVLWILVSKGKIRFTSDWHVEISKR